MKSYAEGGLSYKQFTALLETLSYRESNENKFLAAIHGVKLKDSEKENTKKLHGIDYTQEEIDNMTDAERKELTDKMIEERMKQFSGFVAPKKVQKV